MKISTSILDCDNRMQGVIQLNRTRTSYIHIDVMDGIFVPSVQFSDILEIREIEKISNVPLDIHFMVQEPLFLIEQFQNMKIEFMTIHVEILSNQQFLISKIHEMGYRVGVAVKPGTDLSLLIPYLDEIDMILVMSVEPGYGGQKFMEQTFERISLVKKMIGNRNILIEVDGGIQKDVILKLKDVDLAVVGTYITKSDHYSKRIDELLEK